MSLKGYRLQDSKKNSCANAFAKNLSTINGAGCYLVASSPLKFNNTATGTESCYIMKTDTYVKCRMSVNGDNVYAKFDYNGNTGSVWIGKVKLANQDSAGGKSYTWNNNSRNSAAQIYVTSHPNAISLYLSEKTESFNTCLTKSDGSVNESAVEKNEDADDPSDAGSEENSGTSSSSSSSSSSAATALNISYEYAIEIEPWQYNFTGHYGAAGQVDFDETSAYAGLDYTKLRFIWGTPYQFLPSTDCRVSSGFGSNLEKVGYEISEKITSRIPLLYITPGNVSFMGGNASNENYRTTLMSQITGTINEAVDELTESSLETMLSEYSGKLYTIMPAYTEYFTYVNPLIRSGAVFLQVSGMSFDSSSYTLDGGGVNAEGLTDSDSFINFNWGVCEGAAYEIYEDEETTEEDTEEDQEEETEEEEETTDSESEEETRAKYNRDYSEYFQTHGTYGSSLTSFEKNLYYSNAIAFYINSDASFTDSFTNETTETSLASTINAISDKARELQFLLGTAKNAVGDAFDKVNTLSEASQLKEQIDSIVSKVSGGNSIFTTIANSVKTIISGGRLLFPQIWSNSTFSKSYNISIKLISPGTDRLSWFLNIYVPLCHLLALVCPRTEYTNSYTTPFLIKAFYKGMFNIDMGIITEMSFNRGKEGSWTKDALPTVVDVTFTIQDLYSAMGITSTESMFKGFTLQNVAEMDYIANLCGININEPDTFRMVNFWAAFNVTNAIGDFIPNLSMRFEQYVSTGIINAYNNFWT